MAKEIREIEDLPGIGEVASQKLREAGIERVEEVASLSPHELAEILEVSVEKAKQIVNAAKEAVHLDYQTAWEIFERRKEIGRITTGSKKLDDLLGGGVETQALTEFFGRYSSGKTQVGFQLCVNVQLPKEKGGLEGKVLFIDTESTFRPERIAQMAKAVGLDPKKVLANIFVIKAENSDHQRVALEKSESLIKQENIKLIVVDSLTSHFRAEYVGRGSLGERQQKLNQHIHTLQKFADRYNLAVYYTNQVMDNPGILFGDPTTPIGGHVLAHAGTYRVYLKKAKDTKRIARLVDSPSLPEREVVFRVTAEGIRD